MIYNCILIRYTGEFGVKSTQSQGYIEDLLHTNIKRALTASEGPDLLDRIRFITRQGRLYIYFEKQQDTDVDLVIAVVGRTFGISSISPCFRTSVRDKTAVVSVAAKLMVAHGIGPGSFKIAVRAIKNPQLDIPALKQDITHLCNKILLNNGSQKGFSRPRFKKGPKWKMGPWNGEIESKPEIEVYKDHAFIAVERIKAPGGFPLGLEKQLVALVSGGLDSPIAVWLAMRRGAVPVLVVMDPNNDSQGAKANASAVRESALANIKVLNEYAKGALQAPTVYVVPYRSVLDAFIQHGSPQGITCLLCKRFMYRVAEQIGFLHDCQGIVTGEILGEQASQTAQNLRVLDIAVMMPVHRPLFGFDKDEVVTLAGRVGTMPIAAMASIPCKGVPDRPTIGGEVFEVEKVEEQIDIPKYLEQCLRGLEKVS
ncbi:tRNA sulfurtransferase [Thermodesulfobacteriota bacterium]